MKLAALFLASALLLPAARAFAQSQPLAFVAPAADLQELTGCYPAAQAATPAKGSVTYFGVVNTHDATHEQFARLRQVLTTSQATVILYEKPDMGVDSTEAATIAHLGESGYVRFLAQQRGIRAERFDDKVAEYDYLRTRVEPAQLKLYYLLRASERLHQNTGASKKVLVAAMQQLLRNSASFAPGTEQVIRTMREFEEAYQQFCPASGAWWQRAGATAHPAEAFMQTIDDSLRAFRAERLAQQVTEKVRAGERVLVVLDRSHLPASPTYVAIMPASH